MFTIQQIHEAHAKVKSGADFPKYMQDIIALGVTSFETFVFDNHTHYFGKDNFQIASEGFHHFPGLDAQSEDLYPRLRSFCNRPIQFGNSSSNLDIPIVSFNLINLS